MKTSKNIKTADKDKEYSVEYITGIKPILKWAGGKTQLLEQFENYYPIELKLVWTYL